MEPNERVHRSIGKIIWNNFWGGIAWGLGVTVGLSILFGAIGFLGSKVNWVPVIGKFVQQVTQYAEGNRPRISR
ncbi:MAG: hypothetical protein HYW33_04100 [Candidatus Blackburnbacteria bacterium]|nr:hypothetical protein [Candidatus Blackburnbacteria bacterium]